MNDFEKICGEIRQERDRQIEKWGDAARSPETMLIVIGEEFGEACQAFNDGDSDNYRVELIQVAACCIKAIQSFDREKGKSKPDHIQTNMKELTCDRCKARQKIPSMPLEMVTDFFNSFGRLHENCDGQPPIIVEMELVSKQ